MGDSEDAEELQQAIVTFVTGDYMNILESAHYHTVYNSEVKRYNLSPGDDEASNTADIKYWKPLDDASVRSSSWTTSWRMVAEQCKLHGWDQVTAISQTAINDHFLTLWNNAERHGGHDQLLRNWSFGGNGGDDSIFRVKLGYLSVRLPRQQGGPCILTLHVEEGSIKLPARAGTGSVQWL